MRKMQECSYVKSLFTVKIFNHTVDDILLNYVFVNKCHND